MTETRKLGQGEVRVGAIALGAMAFAGWYDTRDDEGGVLAIQLALDAGITLIDTAESASANQVPWYRHVSLLQA